MSVRNRFASHGYWKYLLLATVLLLTIFVPYHVPVRKVVSLSYVVGFNNRAAVLIFLAGSLLFARLTRFRFGPQDAAAVDQKLGLPSLLVASALTAVLLCAQFFSSRPHIARWEAPYNINRLQMLASHYTPYLQFEYAYGPLHLYLARWLGWLLHLSIFNAYYANWALEWIFGVPLLWYTVRHLQVPLRDRRLIFWGLFCLQVQYIFLEAVSYTPIRTQGAAFLLVIVHPLWLNKNRLLFAWCASASAVVLALLVSPEQGIAVMGGLLLWITLRSFSSGEEVAPVYPSSFLLVCVAVLTLAYRAQYFFTATQFSHGGFAFPLTLSIPIVVILATYAFGACALMECLERKDLRAQTMLLALAGVFLLPAALGRADLGHLQAAAPLLLVGIAYFSSHGRLRQPWQTAAVLTYLLPTMFLVGTNASSLRRLLVRQMRHSVSVKQAAELPSVKPRLIDSDGGSYLQVRGPCSTLYRVIDLTPSPNEIASQNCLEPGYFAGMTNVLTPAAISKLIDDLDRAPRHPILLRDGPTLSQEFNPRENFPPVLLPLQDSWYVPQVRHAAEDYASLQRYLQQHYVPTSEASQGIRIWNPK